MRSPVRRRAVLVVAVAVLLLAGACGTEEPGTQPDDSPTAAASPEADEVEASPTPDVTTAPTNLEVTGLEFAPGRILDVLGADPAKSDLPVVVVLRPRDHVELGQFLPSLVSAGMLVFDAPWLPVEEGGRYPAVLEEVSCAVGYARERAADFGGDPDTITLVAHSAGSYIAALTSFGIYEGDCTSSAGLPDRMVGIAGIYQALTPEERADQDTQIAELLGGPIEDHPDAYADVQPENHLDENPALEIMLIHGDADDIVSVDQSAQWHRRLVDAGYQATLHIVRGDHTSVLLDPRQSETVAAWIRDFADPFGRDIDTLDMPTGSPSLLGFDVAALRAGLDLLESQDTNAHHLVVVRDGTIVIDAAVWPSSAGQPHDLASVTKSVVSLVVGAAIERGDIESLDTPLGAMLELPAGAEVSEVTLRDLLGMRAGLDCSADDAEAELREMGQSSDYVAFAAALPVVGVPGETFGYCSPGYHLVSAAISNASGRSLADYAAETLFEPLGIQDWDWPSDRQGVTHGWGDLALRPVDLARLGQLTLQDGRWGEAQVLPAGFVAELTAAIPTSDPMLDYGLGWWLPTNDLAGVVEGIGRGGQELFVWPEQDLIVVVTGAEADGRLIAHTVAGSLLPEPEAAPDADTEIAKRFADLSQPPAARAASRPAQATGLGQSFDLEPNPLGVDQVRVVHADEAHTTLEVTLDAETFELPVGLDGVARTASDTPTGGPVALSGEWADAVLTIDYEEMAGPDHWTIQIDLGSAFTMTVTDLAGLFPPLVIPGSPAPR